MLFLIQQVRGKFLDRVARSVKLVRLAPDTRYLICVLGLGNWRPPLNRQQANMSGDVLLGDPVPHLTDSQMSRCTEVILDFITFSWSFTSPQQTAGQHERRCVAGRSCSTPYRLADESIFTSPQHTAGQHEGRCVAGRSCSTPDRLADESMYRVGVLPPLNIQQVNISGDVLLGDPVPHLTDSQMSRCTEVILDIITCSWSFTSPQQTAGQHERRCVAGRSCSTLDRLADESMYRVGVLTPLNIQQVNMSGDVLLGDPVPHLTYSQMSRCTEVIQSLLSCSWSFTSPQHTAGQHERRCVAVRSCSTLDRLADESIFTSPQQTAGQHERRCVAVRSCSTLDRLADESIFTSPQHTAGQHERRCVAVRSCSTLDRLADESIFTSPQQTAGQHERRCVAVRSISTPDRLADESMYRVGVLPPLNIQQVNMSGDVLLCDPVPHLTDSQMSRCIEVILGYITCSWSFPSPQQTAGQHERRCVAGRSCSTPDRLADESMYRVGVLPPLNRQQANMSGDVLRRSCSTPDKLADESMYRVGVYLLNRQQANMSGDVLLGDPVPHLKDSLMSRCTECSYHYYGVNRDGYSAVTTTTVSIEMVTVQLPLLRSRSRWLQCSYHYYGIDRDGYSAVATATVSNEMVTVQLPLLRYRSRLLQCSYHYYGIDRDGYSAVTTTTVSIEMVTVQLPLLRYRSRWLEFSYYYYGIDRDGYSAVTTTTVSIEMVTVQLPLLRYRSRWLQCSATATVSIEMVPVQLPLLRSRSGRLQHRFNISTIHLYLSSKIRNAGANVRQATQRPRNETIN
ncbi:hypothetical protein J6590_091145 [Homalodisca vitripennis]|nr:hypothetical protein J6590_091145 [Homalodisca vitripennis]